ncbi:MAG: hypothetical protein JSW55_19870, partial [Chloroflexota bacterium]
MFEMRPDGSIHPLHYRLVNLGINLDALDDRELAGQLHQPERNSRQLVVALQSGQGETIYQNTVRVPLWLRGEFHAGDPTLSSAAIDAHHFPLLRPVFVVRVPAVAGASLVLSDNQLRTLATFDLDQLAQDTPFIHFAKRPRPLSALSSGRSDNRVDILFLGDGYTETQQAKFSSDVAGIAADFFDISPLAEYANFVITHSLFVTSAQAGADHPLYQDGCQSSSCCADTAMLSDPLQGTFVNTAFDARYCTNNIHRLLTVNFSKVLAAAAAVPEWDEIIVVVNDPTYGGAGGSFSVVSTHASATRIAQHEYGHSFVGLADEYETPFPGFPACSDLGGPPCEVNVTDIVTRSLIKWSPWISAVTPIPTEPEFDPLFADAVGLFEGARYHSAGIHRSGQSCIMRALGRPFCQVPSQAYVLRLYDGGWGVPSLGIDLIEPGSAAPEEAVIQLWYPKSQVFEAEILQPAGGPPIDIRWSVDGVQDLLASTGAFTYRPVASDVGRSRLVHLRVRDTTSLVHPAMAGSSLESNRFWRLFVNAAPVDIGV